MARHRPGVYRCGRGFEVAVETNGTQQAENIRVTTAYCMAHPQWRLSVQMHKVMGID